MVEYTQRPNRYPPERASMMTRLLNMILPDRVAQLDETPPPQTPRVIPGGPAAPELCMIPVEGPSIADMAREETDQRRRNVGVLQLKADGINAVRLPGLLVGGREGMPLDCAMHCYPGLGRLEEAYGEPMVFFGEYVADDGFNATIAEQRRGMGDGVFWIHDAMPHAAWLTGREYEVPVEDRLSLLRLMYRDCEPGLFVGLLDSWLLDCGEAHAKAREIWAAGFEGLVRKELGSGLARRRDPRWMKIKQRLRATCPVIDTMHRDGKLRTIIVRGPEAGGSKPLKLTGGWSTGDGESIDIGMAEGSAGRDVEVSFELTVGKTRTIRAPKFERIVA